MKLDFDERFQEHIIRLMHQDKEFGEAALPHLKPGAFENPVHAWTVRMMKASLSLNGHLPDTLMLNNERRKAESFGTIRKEDRGAYRRFLTKKLPMAVPNRTYIKSELHNFVVNQEWKSLILAAVDDHLKKKDFNALRKKALDVLDLDLTGDYSPGTRPAATFIKRMKERKKSTSRGITTGLDALDRLMTGGGMRKKQLGTVIAPTGRGKTNFLINLAIECVLAGETVLYITLELDEDTISTRMDARVTGVSLKHLKSQRLEVKRMWRKMKSKVLKRLIVKEFPVDTQVSTIKAHLRRLERIGFYPTVLVIDYGDLLKASVEFRDDVYKSDEQKYRDLIRLLKEEKLVGWTATQGNRDSLKKDAKGEVNMGMMAGGVSKAFLADVVLGIGQTEKEAKLKQGHIGVLKNRNGATDRAIKVSMRHDVVTFKSMV